jgi:hypothetical protein
MEGACHLPYLYLHSQGRVQVIKRESRDNRINMTCISVGIFAVAFPFARVKKVRKRRSEKRRERV